MPQYGYLIRRPQIVQREPEDKEQIGLIQGRKPDSIEEWRVAVALWRRRLPFAYQVPFRGGYIRGGYILDFVVHTYGKPTVLLVNGEYWHAGQMDAQETWRMGVIEGLLGKEYRVVILWGRELQTQEMANRQIDTKVL